MKIFKFASVLFFFLLSIPIQVFSQDILFKKDASALKVNIINFNGETITYKISGDSPGKTHYLSKSLLDSLKYSDGKLLDFTNDLVIGERPLKQFNRNNFNLEMISLLRGKMNFDYERISKTGRVSIVTGLFINLNDRHNYWYGNPDRLQYSSFEPYSFFVRMGVNSYPFNSSLVRTSSLRFSTGLSVLIGSYRKEDRSTYHYPEGYKIDHVFAASLMWNITEGIYIGNNFQITGTIETSILPFLTFLCPQVGLSVGF